jgi:hypothetical protein
LFVLSLLLLLCRRVDASGAVLLLLLLLLPKEGLDLEEEKEDEGVARAAAAAAGKGSWTLALALVLRLGAGALLEVEVMTGAAVEEEDARKSVPSTGSGWSWEGSEEVDGNCSGVKPLLVWWWGWWSWCKVIDGNDGDDTLRTSCCEQPPVSVSKLGVETNIDMCIGLDSWRVCVCVCDRFEKVKSG